MSKIVPLRQLISFASRGISPCYVEKDGLIVLNQKCIRENNILLDPARLTDKTKKFSEEKKLRKFDILINSTGIGTLGRVAQLTFDLDATVDSHISIFRTSKECDGVKIDPKYIGYSVRFRENEIETLGKGATGQTELSKDSVLDGISIYFPDFPTQTRIASILSAYDDLIENNEKRIKILEEMAQRLYSEWFVKFKFPGHEKVRLIDSGNEYGKIPDGWEVVEFSKAVNVNPSTKLEKKQNIIHVPMESLSNTLSVIDTNKIITKKGGSGVKLKNNDTLFARITPCLQNGKNGFVNFLEQGEVATGSTEFIVLRAKKLTSIYIYFLTRDTDFRKAAEMTMVGASGRQRVQNAFFHSYMVIIPNHDLLSIFEDQTQTLFNEIKKLHKTNQNLSKIRDLLIPQLVSGKRELR